MIVGIGTDLIELQRVIDACENKPFLERVFTQKEQDLIKKDKKKCAGNFAVKEAVVKLFGTGFGKCRPVDIEVLRNTSGAPYIILYGAAKDMAKKLGIERIHVSISNTKEYANAVAIGEGSGNN